MISSIVGGDDDGRAAPQSPAESSMCNDGEVNTSESALSSAGKGMGDSKTSKNITTTSLLREESISSPTSTSKRSSAIEGEDKVKVHFVAVGNAPILKKSKFKLDADQQFAFVTSSLRRTLKLTDSAAPSLLLYCNAAFVPSPDERLGDLCECFSVRGELVIHYSLKEAWG